MDCSDSAWRLSGLSWRPPMRAILILLILPTLQTNLPVWSRTIDESGALVAPAVAPQVSIEERIKLTESATSRAPAECAVFADYGKNYLTPIDILVKAGDSEKACIKARFALSIKVEEAQFLSSRAGENGQSFANQTEHPILGYVPLEHVVSVEESCPENVVKQQTAAGEKNQTVTKDSREMNDDPSQAKGSESETKDVDQKEEDDELEMIVTFDCGKLSFTFRRDDEKVYISSIKGIVKLDTKVIREFVAVRPMFLTSDLNHHFKYDDIIEVVSEVQSKAHILTANFYFTEFEAFRSTASRDFEKPPDEKSTPFPEE